MATQVVQEETPIELSPEHFLSGIRELINTGETATLNHWGDGKFVLGENGKWHFEGFISLFQALYEAMRVVDPTLPPGLPPHCLDVEFVGSFFGIPLEDFNWQGASAADQTEEKLDRILANTEALVGQTATLSTLTPAAGQALTKKNLARSEMVAHDDRNLLKLRQCVASSGHSESTLRRAIKDGRLTAHTIGRGRKRPTYGIYRCDLQGFIEASRVQPPDSPRIPTIGVRKKSRHFD